MSSKNEDISNVRDEIWWGKKRFEGLYSKRRIEASLIQFPLCIKKTTNIIEDTWSCFYETYLYFMIISLPRSLEFFVVEINLEGKNF